MPFKTIDPESSQRMNLMKMNERRFYATKSALEYPRMVKTYDEAVADAASKMNERKSGIYYVVEIVAVIKPMQVKTPVIVEDFNGL